MRCICAGSWEKEAASATGTISRRDSPDGSSSKTEASGSRDKSPDVAREERRVAQVAGADELLDPSLDADRESAVWRHAVAEGLQVAGERREFDRAGSHRGFVVGEGVQPLAPGRELEAAEEEVGTVLAERPRAEPPLMCGSEIWLGPHLFAELAGQKVLRLCEVEPWEGRRCADRKDRAGAVGVFMAAHRARHRPDDAFEDGHHVVVVADESHLGIERDVFVQVARCVMRLRAEDRPHLEDALEDTDEDLLVELRALSEICGLTEVVHAEAVRATLGRRRDNLRGKDLGETLRAEALAVCRDARVHEAERSALPA